MTKTTTSLSPELQRALETLLQRYRRHRFLRATLRGLIWAALPTLALLITWGSGTIEHSGVLFGVESLILTIIAIATYAPLLRHPLSLRDIARHVDRCHPELKDRLLSAVALSESATPSDWMVAAFFEDTTQRIVTSPLDHVVQPESVRRIAFLTALSILLYVFVIGGAWQLGSVLRSTHGDDAASYTALASLLVEPGDTTVSPGESVMVWVTSDDTTTSRRIFWESDTTIGEASLVSTTSPRVSHYTFSGVEEDWTYWVEMGRQISPRYQIHVSTPPEVESIGLHYRYPEYLGQGEKDVPFGGDISAVEGTEITLLVQPNKAVETVHLVLASGEEIALTPEDGGDAWTTTMTLAASDTYHVALRDLEGAENAYPAEYKIVVHPDGAPEIRVRQPRGDREVLSLEEVPFAFDVSDDYGVFDYGIEYVIAGREPVRVAMGNHNEALREVVGAHELALESLGVQPGDLITWSIWADDAKPGRKGFETLSDPYFLEVRPYTRRFREQVSQAGPAGQSDSGVEQRSIVIALWNLRKAAPNMESEAVEADKAEIALAQQGLREKAEAGMQEGGPEAEILQEAVASMKLVEEVLDQLDLAEATAGFTEAIDHAQNAMHHLMRLTPEERQIARSEGAQGGGGGSQEEIDELELSKRKDYQEEARTGEQAVEEAEALRNRLEELAQRQEILNEDVGRTEAEAETLSEAEKKRRLERIQQEQQRQIEALDEVANRVAASAMEGAQREEALQNLEQARERMAQSLESLREEALQQARAAGSRAESALNETEAALSQLSREGAREHFDELQEDLADLAERHQGLEAERAALKEESTKPGLADADEATERMENFQRDKAALAQSTRDFLEEAGGLSDRLRKEQEFFARKLGDWARETGGTGVVDDMLEGPRYAQYGMWDAAGMADAKVREKLAAAQEGLGALSESWPEDEIAGMEEALDRLAALDEALKGEGSDLPSPAPGDEEGNSPGAATPGNEEGNSPGAVTPGSEGAEGQSSSPQPAGSAEGTNPGSQGTPGENPGAGKGAEGEGSGQESSGSTPGSSSGPGDSPSGTSAGGGSGGDGPRRGANTGGDGLEELLDSGAWRDEIADAVALLPREAAARNAIEEVGMNLGRLQREYDTSQVLPSPSEFEQVVQRPLRDAIEVLESEVARTQAKAGRRMEDEGAVPERYVDRVAEYFRLLAEDGEQP